MSDKHNGNIIAVGMFDGVHLGHRSLLSKLKQEGEFRHLNTMVMTFSQHPLSIIDPQKTPKLLSDTELRQELIENYGIDNVVIQDFTSELRQLKAVEFITMLSDKYNMKALVSGFNNRLGSDRIHMAEHIAELSKSCGVEIIIAEEYSAESANISDLPVCSSSIRRYIAEGKIEEADKMLGYDYTLRGKVCKGKQLGSKIGFPTANIIPLLCQSAALPAVGVYVVNVKIEGDSTDTTYRGMANIGYRPTVDCSCMPQLSVEINIFNFSEDIYDRILRVSFVRRLRDEIKFDSLDALTAQLNKDRILALK